MMNGEWRMANRGIIRACHLLFPTLSTLGVIMSAVAIFTCGAGVQSLAQEPGPAMLPEGFTPSTKAAIDRGLAYLSRTQDRQGSWSNQGRYGKYPVAMTALAGLAFLMDGNTTTQGRYAPHVDRATRYLLHSATPTGLIARPEHEGRPMYGHGFSMLFLSQLYGMTEDPARAREIHDVLARAVQLTARAQSADGGWYYTPDSRNDEGSVTIT